MSDSKYTVLVHPATGKRRRVKNGFSGTVFLFSIFALLIRRQFKLAAIFLGIIAATVFIEIYVLEAVFGIYVPGSIDIVIAIVASTALGAVANDLLRRQLLRQGYVAQQEE